MYKLITINNDWVKCRIVSEEELREENKPVNELHKLREENHRLKQIIEEYKQLVDTLIHESDEGEDHV